jgi:hypothetical protein
MQDLKDQLHTGPGHHPRKFPALLRLHAPDSLKELLMSDPSVLQYIDYIRKISDAITEREEGLLDADVKASAGATVSKTRL